ncbi:MAG TPA: efflux transporter outer membrane subunit [Chryseosolibacter sp.]
MFNKKPTARIIFLIPVVALVAGCKVATPPSLPVAAKMPDTYIGNTDSATVASIRWQDFFTDPHLVALIDTALKNNLDLRAAIQRVEMARANFIVSKGALFPSLRGVASADLGSVGNNMVNNPSDQQLNNLREEYFLGLQSSWEADVWGKLKNEKKAAYSRFLASEKGKHLVTTALVAEIARLYYELLSVDNELEVVRKNINFQKIALDIIQIQKMGGRATELAVQQFTAQLLSTQALEKEKQQRTIELETQLNLLLGRYPQPVPRGNDISEQPLPPTIEAGIPSALILNRPDIQQAELALMAAEADVQAARAAFLPSVTLSPYVGLNALRSSLLFQAPESLAAGLLGSLSAPIFNKNRIRAGFNYSVAARAEAYYHYQKTIITGYGEVVNNIRSIGNLQEIYKLKEQQVDALQKAVSTSNVLFTSGYASYLEVITAQKSVLEAELELAHVKKGIFHSVIALYRALGGGWNR